MHENPDVIDPTPGRPPCKQSAASIFWQRSAGASRPAWQRGQRSAQSGERSGRGPQHGLRGDKQDNMIEADDQPYANLSPEGKFPANRDNNREFSEPAEFWEPARAQNSCIF